MTIDASLLARIKGVAGSPSLRVIPAGAESEVGRAIFAVRDFGRLQEVVKATFAAGVLLAAMAIPAIAHAEGVGYDANVYGQAQSQVMQAGSAVRMTVIDVRPVRIEVAPGAPRGNLNMGYAVMAAAGGAGALIGNNVGGNNQSVHQLGSILGGLVGVLAGSMANEAMNAPAAARMIDGTEITMADQNDQVRVVTQAGSQQFLQGDRVLVTTVGGNTRVVADRSHAVQRVAQMDVGSGYADRRAVDVPSRDVQGSSGVVTTGKILDVDVESGIVLQKTGRNGETAEFDLSKLSMRPAVGDVVSISVDRNGFGSVQELGREAGRGGR